MEQQVPTYSVQYSSEDAKKKMEETTRQELEKLMQEVKNKEKLPKVESESFESESESESEEEYIPKVKKRKMNDRRDIDVNSKMYNDNQMLWKKCANLEKERASIEIKYHYAKLDLNNALLEVGKFKSEKSVNEKNLKELEVMKRVVILFKVYVLLSVFLYMNIGVDYVSGHIYFRFIYNCNVFMYEFVVKCTESRMIFF